MPCTVAMPASRNDVRLPVAAPFAARDEVFGCAAQMRWPFWTIEPHSEAAVVALAALAVERELSGGMKLVCHWDSWIESPRVGLNLSTGTGALRSTGDAAGYRTAGLAYPPNASQVCQQTVIAGKPDYSFEMKMKVTSVDKYPHPPPPALFHSTNTTAGMGSRVAFDKILAL